jgi:hypothetical protein
VKKGLGGHLAWMTDGRGAYIISVVKTEEWRIILRSRLIRDDIAIDLQEKAWGCTLDWSGTG